VGTYVYKCNVVWLVGLNWTVCLYRYVLTSCCNGALDCSLPLKTDVLAIMGPSGAGKTTLISTLTLDAFYGKPNGSVTLNGVPITNSIFKEHCYVVVQHDKHWPYLTCRETLQYAAELYEVAAKEDVDAIVNEIIQKMGLNACADTRNARLSGGQRRRLSIGIALLKQPTLLFLDEPTSGLDAGKSTAPH
jgi:ABC-type multidrug transport system ATPase subunit